MTTTILLLIGGLIILILGADSLLRGATRPAAALEISWSAIGLTIVEIRAFLPVLTWFVGICVPIIFLSLALFAIRSSRSKRRLRCSLNPS